MVVSVEGEQDFPAALRCLSVPKSLAIVVQLVGGFDGNVELAIGHQAGQVAQNSPDFAGRRSKVSARVGLPTVQSASCIHDVVEQCHVPSPVPVYRVSDHHHPLSIVLSTQTHDMEER